MQTFSIGRDANNQIILNDNFVSRRHAELIISDNGAIIIKDLGSANGTFVNGNKISEYYIKPGDIIKCASVFLNWQEIISKSSVKTQPSIQQPSVQQPIQKPLAQQPPIQQSYTAPVVESFQANVSEKKAEKKKIVNQPKDEPLENNNDEKLLCPRCHSSNIHIDKKGFGGAKACCGGLACGPLGLLFGTAGQNKLRKTCLKCNNSWF